MSRTAGRGTTARRVARRRVGSSSVGAAWRTGPSRRGREAAPLLAQHEPDAPRFQSAVEVTSIDVTVVDDRGRPILDLKPGDFSVRIDNAPRRVVTAEWTPLMTEIGPPPPAPPDGYSTNESVRVDG